MQHWRDARRRELTVARCAVPTPVRHQRNATITQRLQTQFAALQGLVVSGYRPFRGEFDPRFLLHHLRCGGARTALPVVAGRGMPLQFRAWWPGAPMRRAVLGLPEPDNIDVLTPQALLMPPLGFDAHGYRQGHGGGCFDRMLTAMPGQPLQIGVAFELSRMATIGPQWHDVRHDADRYSTACGPGTARGGGPRASGEGPPRAARPLEGQQGR